MSEFHINLPCLKRRGAGVVELARLESEYAPKRHRGFESPSLRTMDMNMKLKLKLYPHALLGVFFLAGCFSNEYRMVKSPVDDLIRDHLNYKTFSILLFDMDYEEETDRYRHQYRVIWSEDTLVKEKTTKWQRVDAPFFEKHLNDMGMELASKRDGKVHRGTAPPGYSSYVGSPQHGHWVQRGGSSFWEFYGQYAFMSSLFYMMARPAPYSMWNTYQRGYYGTGNSYYGTAANGRSYYGTSSHTAQRRNSRWGSRSSSFKSRVRNRISRSRSSWFSSSRTSRTSSRSGSSAMRSRGMRFGK